MADSERDVPDVAAAYTLGWRDHEAGISPRPPLAAQPSAEPDWRQLYEDQLARYARRFNAEAAQPSAEPGLHPDDADAKRRPIQTVGGVRVGAAALTPDRPTPGEPVTEG